LTILPHHKISFPVAWNQSIFDVFGTFIDKNHILRPAAGGSLSDTPFIASLVVSAKAGEKFFLKLPLGDNI
jgi:hypothetical protein